MIRNITYSFFTRFFIALMAFASLLVISRYLGSSVYGHVSIIILNVAIIQAVAEIYSGSALVHFIPRSSLLRIYLTGLLWIVLAVLAVNAIIIFFGIGEEEYSGHVLFISFIATLHAFHNVLLLGKQKIASYNFLLFFQPALNLGILCINVFFFNISSVYSVVISLYISYFVSVSLSGLLVFRTLTFRGEQDFSLKAVFRNGLMNQLGNLSHILSNRFNYYVLSGVSIAMVGVYSGSTSLIESVLIISGSISPLVLTRIANRSDSENDVIITFLLAKLSFLLTLLCVIVIWLLPSGFFVFLLGRDFSQARTVMLYLSPGVLCLSFSSILSHFFSGLGRQRVLLFANSSGLVVTLCLSYIMISKYGLVGACLTASAAYLTQALFLLVIFMRENRLSIAVLFSFRNDLNRLGSG